MPTDSSAKLTVTPEVIDRALACRAAEQQTFDGLQYVRFADGFDVFARGTVVLGDRVLAGFPSIGRIYVLEAGIKRAFRGVFYAEEKIDGYNVRVVRHAGRILPFTRGGFVCPFTNDRLRDFFDFEPFFDRYPDGVLCGEVAGPANPYIDTAPPEAPSDDVAFFAFDIMHLDRPDMLPLEERDAIFHALRIPRAPLLGRFSTDNLQPLREQLERLDRSKSEGVVLKPPAQGLRLKYTTPSINLYDVTVDAPLLAELPGEFFVHRIIRLVLAYEDMGKHDQLPEVARELGRTLAGDFLLMLRRVRDGGVVSKRFRIKVHSDQAADQVLRHLNRASKKIQVHEISRVRSGPFVVVTFDKIFQQSTSWLHSLLDGQHIIE